MKIPRCCGHRAGQKVGHNKERQKKDRHKVVPNGFKAVNVWPNRKQILCTTELSNAHKQGGIVVGLYAGLSRFLTTLIVRLFLQQHSNMEVSPLSGLKCSKIKI